MRTNTLFKCVVGLATVLLFLFFLAALGNIVWKGLGSLLDSLNNPEIHFAIRLSLFTSVLSTSICFLFALPIAYGMERFQFPGHRLIQILLGIPISLPPLVSGVALLLLFSSTPLGKVLAEFGIPFIFSVNGIILAQFFIITPYLIRILQTTFAGINPRYEFVARTLGCNQWQAFYKVALPLAKNGILSGLVISWSRAISEFGCALMVAGATRMVTETLPIALYLNMSVGNLETAMAAATCLILISMTSLTLLEIGKGRAKKNYRSYS